MVKGYFYNSNNGDRKYNANSVNESKRPFYRDGVFFGQMMVTAKSREMAVVVDGGRNTGYAWINAHTVHNDEPLELDISQSSGTLNRIDRVVLRNDETLREPSIYILEGAFSKNPAAELTNNETVQEKCLAEVYVKAGAVEITQADITDTRADGALCGFVASQIQEISFDQWKAQFDSFFEQKKKSFDGDYDKFMEDYEELKNDFINIQEEEIKQWFAGIREQLSDDAAIALLDKINREIMERENAVTGVENKIGVLSSLSTAVKTSIVEAVNSLLDTVNTIKNSYASGVKGNAESTYRKGNVNITPANIGLGNVNNTADSAKSVKYAASAGTCDGQAAGSILQGVGLSGQVPYDYTEVQNIGGDIRSSLTGANGSFLVVQVGIPSGAHTLQNIIVPYDGASWGHRTGFHYRDGSNYYSGVVTWIPSGRRLKVELTEVSNGWKNSIYVNGVWKFGY